LSARVDYVINDADHATHYHSGNEFMAQFDVRKNLPRSRASLGLIGYFYQQTTDDKQNGVAVVSTNADGSRSTGFRGRTLDLGPQVSFPIGAHGGMAFKWDHDMLVQNKSQGNAFWFQFSVPFGYMHHLHKPATS
jgi:hypothetical protein